jgi:hypothetical protein
MLRSNSYGGHRRYSITHRAVQRLRELVQIRGPEDDEEIRDRLDRALTAAEERGDAIKTVDAMLGEPQTLIPVPDFGDVLYAIVKEDTVVTVLPRGHGEEILHRGQALEGRLPGAVTPRGPEEDRGFRPRWRRDTPSPVVVERIVRGASAAGVHTRVEPVGALGGEPAPLTVPDARSPIARAPSLDRPVDERVSLVLQRAMQEARRRAAVAALREVLADQRTDSSLIPLWNQLAEFGVPTLLTIGDLLEAARSPSGARP